MRTTTQTPPSEQPFSLEIKESTRKVHSMAEQTAFIRGFLRGTASCESYLSLLSDFLPVYEAMEDCVDRLTIEQDPIVQLFYFPELRRKDSLIRDIEYLKQLTGIEDVVPTLQSNLYKERILKVSKESPDRLIGHIYTRYLGDLSGGQVLARIASRSMGLSIGRGLDFYDFPEIENISSMKQRFRAALDLMKSNPYANTEAIIEEAILAFHYNIKIFQQLQGNSWISLLRNLPLLGMRSRNPEVA